MGKADHDLIDSAMDAAMEQIDAKSEPTEEVKIEGVDENTEETPEAPQEEALEAKEEDSEESSEETAEEISDQTANAEEVVTQEAQPQAAATNVIAPPANWTADEKALFSKAPPELQKALVEREVRLQQLISRNANESQRGRQWETRVNSDFETKEELDAHRAMLKLKGINDEVGELHNYRAWNKLFRHDTVLGIQSLMQEHGVTLEELSGETQSEEQERYANDPRVDAIIEEMRQEREALEASKKEAERNALQSQINNWKVGNDKYGKPRAEFVQLYGPQIDMEWQQVINEAGQNGRELSLEDSLTEAFERVQSKVFKAHGINPNAPKAKTPEQVKAHASKVQAAVTKASGAPRSDTITKKARPEYKNDKERVEAAVKRAEEKLSNYR